MTDLDRQLENLCPDQRRPIELRGDMIVIQLLSQLRSREIKLWVEDDQLRYDAPRGALTPDMRAELAARKTEVIAFLRQIADGTGMKPIRPAPRTGPLPLSFAQQRLWFLQQLNPDSPAYHLPYALRLSGALDLVALVRTLNILVARHESLRTTFELRDGQPTQQIAAPAPGSLPVLDLTGLPSERREPFTYALVRHVARQPFDLERGPLLRVMLLRLGAEEHVFGFTMHHIISDGWSQSVLIREVVASYTALRTGRKAALPALPIQYADYALWQREWLQGAVLDAQLAYWKHSLAGAPALLELPTDRPRPAVASGAGTSLPLALDATLTSALHELSRRAGTTLFMILVTALQGLLARYSGQDDISLGTPIAGRTQAATEPLIGFFVNTLVLRTKLVDNISFAALLAQVRATCLDAYAHQDVPFEQLVEVLQPARSLSAAPLFQVMFVLQNAPQELLELGELTLRPLSSPSASAKFDLTLTLNETRRGLVGAVEYATDLFDATTIQRLGRHLATLLRGAAAAPERSIRALPLLDAAEREQLLVEWNATSVEHPQDRPIHELVAAQAARRPHAIAVVYGSQHLSYAELDRRSQHLAYKLRERNVGPEGLVGIYLHRSPELVIGALGVLKTGAAYLPLDPAYPSQRLAFVLADSGAWVVLTNQYLRASIPLPSSMMLCLDSDWSRGAQARDPALPARLSSKQLAYLIYTSGSTGSPKGVAIPQRGLLNLIGWHVRVFGVSESDRATLVAGVAFDASVWELWPYLTVGASVHIPNDALRTAPEALRDWLVEQAISVCFMPTPLAEQLLLLAWPRRTPLRTLLTGGDRLHASPPAQLPFSLINNYGPSEQAVVTTSISIMPGRAGDAPPIGRPIANTQVYVLDPQMNPLPIGVAGELYIGGAGEGRGYHGRPDLTAERFVPNPFAEVSGIRYRVSGAEPSDTRYPAPDTRLYKTGDRVRWLADGTLSFLGRIDGQVKLRGYRIELGEIEALLRQHKAVREGVVLVRQDTPGVQQLVAYVVPAGERRTTKDDRPSTIDDKMRSEPSSIVHRPSSLIDELRGFLKERLPEYMLPSLFVVLDELPLTPNGKLDRKALPAPERGGEADEYSAPNTPTEELLATLWAGVLRRERVGATDNFFALGGHSLLATQVITRVRQTFAVELPLRALFEAPTVRDLAAQLRQAQQPAGRLAQLPLLPQPRGASAPLSFAQERLWFIDQLTPGIPSYNIPLALRLHGQLDLGALQRSITALVRRHEALRTTFASQAGTPMQQIAPPAPLPLHLLDLHGLASALQSTLARQTTRTEAQRPFDLARGPLVRVTLLRLNATEHLLVVTLHHIISDGWSLGVIVRELAALYSAYRQRAPVVLPALPVQYADYAIWQREWLQDELLAAQLGYWRSQLGEPRATLELSIALARPPAQTFAGATAGLSIDTALTARLQELSRRAGATLFMTLLAGFNVLLYRYSGQDDILVGSPIANRVRPELEGLIGFFVNTLVLRSDLRGNPNGLALLERVREVCLQAYAHQDVPFERIVEELQPERDLSRTPLFQVMLVLQNAPLSQLALPGLELRPAGAETGTARFDLIVSLGETSEGLAVACEYNTDLFRPEAIARLLRHYQTLLDGLAATPERRIDDLALLTAAEREQIVYEWNATAADTRVASIHEVIAAQVMRTPDAVALVFEQMQLTYRELDRQANRLAQRLRALGVGPDVRVGLCLERSLELLLGVLGILKAGGAYVPLDPNYPPERLALMLADAGCRVLLTQPQLVSRLLPDRQRSEAERTAVLFVEAGPEGSRETLATPIGSVAPEHLAYVIYTSGSTGRPKGVAMPHGALANLLGWQRHAFALSWPARTAQYSTISFDASFQEIASTWSTGGALVLVADDVRRDPIALLGFLDVQLVERLFLPFVALQQLAEEVTTQGAPAQLREVITAGEQLRVTPAILGWLQDRGARWLHNQYGPSETHVVTAFTLPEGAEAWPTLPPIGRPIANTQIYLLDRSMQPVPVGVPGELYIGGANLARGYLGRPDLTAERFIPNPFVLSEDERRKTKDEGLDSSFVLRPLSRLYHTGDLARYQPDGMIEFLGRSDQQVKLRGYRIEPGEIETILEQHPDVYEAVVLVREDAPGAQRLVAYIVPRLEDRGLKIEDSDQNGHGALSSILYPLSSELRGFLAARLPDYMIPSAFVVLDALPLTPSGKLDRRALPTPDVQQLAEAATSGAPRTAIEELLAGAWATLLGVGQVRREDNFFTLGGHSLLATRVIARVRDVFGVELPLRTLFEAPTLAEFAARIELARQGEQHLAAPPLTPQPRTELLPLSFAQQRLWFLQKFDPTSSAYHLPYALHLSGALDLAALAHTLNTVVARHESLRTTFELHDGLPIQQIDRAAARPLPLVDLRALVTEQRELIAQALARQIAGQPFDLACGPLLRVAVLRQADDQHVLLLTMHHIISDGWSQGVLVREVAQLYGAFHGGRSPDLPTLPIQYADYALWQRQWLQGSVLDAQLDYWRARLAGAPPLLDLPLDHPRPPVMSDSGTSLPLALDAPLTAALQRLSRQTGTTLFMTLLAVFQTLLARYSNQRDIVVGTPIAGRTHAATEGLIGFFVNTLVLRTTVVEELAFVALLAQVRQVCLDAYTHQDVPFEQLVEMLQPVRSLSVSPLFQVMFVLQNAPQQALELGELRLHPLGSTSTTAKFDLTLALGETPLGLAGSIEYKTELFDATTIKRLERHLQTLLAGIAAAPERRIGELPLLSEAERHQFLVEWSTTAAEYLREAAVQTMFEAQVARTPDAIAVCFERSPTRDVRCPEGAQTNDERGRDAACLALTQHLTYGELNRRANQLARHLQSLEVGPDVCVGICLDRSLELVVGMMGVLKAGGAYVPLDPMYPAERLAFMLEDSGARVLLTKDEGRRTKDEAQEPTADCRLPTDKTGQGVPLSPYHLVDLEADWPRIAQESAANPAREVSAGNLAYIIYTSGSTGAPKGVMIAHGSLAIYAAMARRVYVLTPADRVLQFASISFDISVEEIFPSLASGATLVLRTDAMVGSAATFLARCRDWAISILDLPTAYWHELTLGLAQAPAALPPSLRLVIIGGERALPERRNQWLRHADRRVRLVNTYGPTEATVIATLGAITDDARDAASEVAIGRALDHVAVYVLDRTLRPTPIGVAGELYIGGAGLARGYLGRPDLTAERFIPNPFAEVSGIRYRVLGAEPSDTRYPTPDTRLYKTGDLVRYRRDGVLEYLGRTDQQVKLRGFRIEPGEIETVLRSHQAVQTCVVLVREDMPGTQRLVAYIVPTEDERRRTKDEDSDSSFIVRRSSLVTELRDFLRGRLPEYMLPAAFVVLDALPLTSNGKLNRKALPAPDQQSITAAYVAPRDALEQMLAGIWAAVLGRERVGVADNFFELGGHSLLAMRLLERVRQATGQQLALASLFQSATIAAQAALLRQRPAARSWQPLVALRRHGRARPLFLVHGIGGTVLGYQALVELLGSDQPVYGLQARGVDDDAEPLDTITEMASAYLAALRVVQPHGPYRLLGWSFGGLVAFEIACQLAARGEAVEQLVLLDTWLAQPFGVARAQRSPVAAFAAAMREQLGLGQDIKLALREGTDEEQLIALLRQGQIAGLLAHDMTLEQLRQRFRVFSAHERARTSYLPSAYAGPLLLLRAREEGPAAQDDPSLGWEAALERTVTIAVVPGNHYTMLQPPHVTALASYLHAEEDKVQADGLKAATDISL